MLLICCVVIAFSMHVFLTGLNSVFLVLVYQKTHTLIGNMEHIIVNYDKYSGLLLLGDVCGAETVRIVNKTLLYF